MGLLIMALGLIGLALVGRLAGADSRPCFDDEPHRQV